MMQVLRVLSKQIEMYGHRVGPSQRVYRCAGICFSCVIEHTVLAVVVVVMVARVHQMH